MLQKPKHLGPEYGAVFQDRCVVEAYSYRPSYPAEVFDILAGLITSEPRHVLDVCNSSYTFALIVIKVCPQMSVNCSVLRRGFVIKLCPSCEFRAIAQPRKLLHVSNDNTLVMSVLLVLAANLL